MNRKVFKFKILLFFLSVVIWTLIVFAGHLEYDLNYGFLILSFIVSFISTLLLFLFWILNWKKIKSILIEGTLFLFFCSPITLFYIFCNYFKLFGIYFKN